MLSPSRLTPARWAARAVLQISVADSRPLPPLYHRQHQCQQQQRQYAMQSPTVRRRRPRRGPDNDGLLFKPSDIPSIDVWREFQSRFGLGDLTPEQCLSAAIQYCNVATSRSGLWKEALEKEYDIDSYTLHYTGLTLSLKGRQGRSAALGAHMLRTASSLGYTPSTLVFIDAFARSRAAEGADSTPLAREMISRFERALTTEKDPDAFTLKAMMLRRNGRSSNVSALRWLDKAIETGRSLPPGTPVQMYPRTYNTPSTVRGSRWSFEAPCYMHRGLILLELKRTEEALAAFRIAALELDHGDAYTELAKLMPQDAPERETYLVKAAEVGNFEAGELLALHMADRAADSKAPQEDRLFAAAMAHEWAAVNPDMERWEVLQALVTEKTREMMPKGEFAEQIQKTMRKLLG